MFKIWVNNTKELNRIIPVIERQGSVVLDLLSTRNRKPLKAPDTREKFSLHNFPYGICWDDKNYLIIDFMDSFNACERKTITLKEFLDITEEIRITRSEDKVIAEHWRGKKYEKTIARCHPEDKFEFNKGAAYAFTRLIALDGKEPVKEVPKETEPPKKSSINVGDKVVVTDREKNYSSFSYFQALKPFETLFDIGHGLQNGKTGIVISKGLHPKSNIELAVILSGEKSYIISVDGLKKV